MTLCPEAKNRLAAAVQEEVPLASDPFAALAAGLSVGADEVLTQLAEWETQGSLREISAILEGEALGYESALVAARVAPEEIDRVAEVVNRHPTVTHNYQRDHAYNLWFTLAVPEEMGLERTLSILSAEADGVAFAPLRRRRTYKIGVRFSLETSRNDSGVSGAATPVRIRPDERLAAILRALQTPLPLEPAPFGALAAQAGCDEETFLSWAGALRGRVLRRYAATFRHHHLGVLGNGMVVWRIPEERLDDAGRRLAEAPEVSHCYARETVPDFPYSLYSMLHAPDEEGVRRTARSLASEVGVEDYLILFSVREFKKCRLRYLLPELDRWWSERWLAPARP
ncbi:MAG: hypothetical protein HY720_11810 [Planctomycetes bacterium]|nr:hypothetical protein [Planctomycetota bacterium]